MYEHIISRNDDYFLQQENAKLANFWRHIFKSPEDTRLLLKEFHPRIVFSKAVEAEEIIEALLAEGGARVACISEAGKPRRLPAKIRALRSQDDKTPLGGDGIMKKKNAEQIRLQKMEQLGNDAYLIGRIDRESN